MTGSGVPSTRLQHTSFRESTYLEEPEAEVSGPESGVQGAQGWSTGSSESWWGPQGVLQAEGGRLMTEDQRDWGQRSMRSHAPRASGCRPRKQENETRKR